MTDSDKIVSLPDIKTIESQAADWLVRLDDEESSPQDFEAFLKWRNQSEQHHEAFERLSRYWRSFDQLDELNDYAASVDAAAIARFDENRAPRRMFLKIAASFALVMLAAVIYSSFQGLVFARPEIYQTTVGERKSINLTDGTIIELNTNSIVEASYSKSARDVRLVQGEAYFEVAHDPSRPFSVFAGRGVVTAIGTAFTVRMHDEKIDVVVSTGRVTLAALDEVSPNLKPSLQSNHSSPLTELEAGQDAVFDEKIEHIGDLDPGALSRKLSWRNGVLSFAGEPLSDVVANMSRYTNVKIEIDDDELRRLPVDGYFRIGEVDTMLEALEVMADLQVEYVSANHVRLSRRSGS